MINGAFPTASSMQFTASQPLYSWVVDILPYIDNVDLSNAWDRKRYYNDPTATISGNPPNFTIGNTGIGILKCPEDLTALPGQGNLSYVVNMGFTRWHANVGTPAAPDVLRLDPHRRQHRQPAGADNAGGTGLGIGRTASRPA